MNKDMDEQQVLSNTNQKSRANRLTNIRKSLGLTRKRLGELSEVSPRSIENWEYGRFGGLTEFSGHKLIKAFASMGCTCSLEWLMNGTGPMPVSPSLLEHAQAVPSSHDENLYREIELLKSHVPNLLVLEVNDNAMEPIFMVGDYVAGIINQPMDSYIGKHCIIKIVDSTPMIRLVRAGSHKGAFNFCLNNTSNSGATPILHDQIPEYIAPIIWYRAKI